MSSVVPIDHLQSEGFSLEALKAGDRAEFSRLVDTYSGKIYRLAIKMLNHPQDAEDILQETFLKAYRYLPEFDGRSKLSTWLYRIATNEALMFIRRHKAQLVSIDEQVETDDGDMEPTAIIDWCCMPESELMSSEGRAYLDLAIQKMPESLRLVFLLRDIESLSTAETAEALGLSETAVKTRLSRARMYLREELSHYYGERLEGQTYGAH